jgi:hypothetical protein
MSNKPTLPNKEVLRAAYDQAIRELPHADLLSGPWYQKTAQHIFEAGYRALQDSLELKTKRQAKQLRPTIRVISSPVGSGKTSFATAFIAACVRTSPEISCVLVLDKIDKCEEKYSELQTLIPGKVSVWWKEQDHFEHDQLAQRQVGIVTHKHYAGSKSDNAKHWHGPNGWTPRTLTVIDEAIDFLHRVDIKQTDASDVYQRVASLPRSEKHMSNV